MRRIESGLWGAILLLVFFGLSMLDWIFTVFFLANGATELNPVVAWLLDDTPLTALLFKLAVCVPAVLFFSYQWHRKWLRNTVVFVVLLYVLLVLYELILYVLYFVV